MTQQQARLDSMRNHMLVILDSELDNIKRIADEIPQDSRDGKVIAMSMMFLAAWLLERRAEAEMTP